MHVLSPEPRLQLARPEVHRPCETASTDGIYVPFVQSGGNEVSQFARYGDPIFSPVPLERPAVNPAASDSVATNTQESWQGHPFRDDVLYSFFAQRESSLHTALTLEEWHVGLSLQRRVPGPVDLTADTLLSRLLALGPARFVYFYDRLHFPTDTHSGIAYVGSATLTDAAAPVPEPASMILVGSGSRVSPHGGAGWVHAADRETLPRQRA